MLEIVAGIGDHGQRVGRQDAVEPERQLGAADPARQRQHRVLRSLIGTDRAPAGGPGRRPAHPAPIQARPRTSTIGIASSAWPITSEAAAAISSAKPVSVTSSVAAEQIGMAAPVDHRRQPGGAERDADRAAPPRPAEAVADDDRDRARRTTRPAARRKRVGRAVGVDRQQQHPLGAVAGRDIGMVDPGIGHDEAEPVLGDHQVRPMAHDPLRFRQHDLDEARVLLDLGGERDRLAPTARRSRHRQSGPRPSRRSSARRPAHRRARDAARSRPARRRSARRDRRPAAPSARR